MSGLTIGTGIPASKQPTGQTLQNHVSANPSSFVMNLGAKITSPKRTRYLKIPVHLGMDIFLIGAW